jgi:hypothetical protein
MMISLLSLGLAEELEEEKAFCELTGYGRNVCNIPLLDGFLDVKN